MAMKVLADIRDREWDLYRRQLDARRTQQLIEAETLDTETRTARTR